MRVNVITPKKQEFMGRTYYLCGFYFQRKGVRLHRVVWEQANGKIPPGYQLHHKDGDKSNNQLFNLELMKDGEHQSLHNRTENRLAYGRMHIERIRPLASKWHGSKEGLEWHREQGKRSWEGRKHKQHTCTHCGKTFETRHRYQEGATRFCHQNCRAAYRRKRLAECV